jgi:hypothetical protein
MKPHIHPVCMTRPVRRLADGPAGLSRRSLGALAVLPLIPAWVPTAHARTVPPGASSLQAGTIERFVEGSWSELQASLPRPAIVLFSSLHCPTCPDAARRAAEARQRFQAKAPLVIVVTDGEDDLERCRSSYQSLATRLLVFDGLAAVLRREVSVRWRGETPWFALLHRDGSLQMQAGVPTPSQWEAWAQARPAR